jgi:hypothetical protein
VVHAQAAFRHHFFDISIANRILKISTNAQQQQFVSEVSFTKTARTGASASFLTASDHGTPVCDRSRFTAEEL